MGCWRVGRANFLKLSCYACKTRRKLFLSFPGQICFISLFFNSTRTIFVWGTEALSIMDFTVDLKQHYSVNIAPSKNTNRFQKRQLWQQKLKEMTNDICTMEIQKIHMVVHIFAGFALFTELM